MVIAPSFVSSAKLAVPLLGVLFGSGGSPTSFTFGLVSVALVSAYLHGPEVDLAGCFGVGVGVAGVLAGADEEAAAAGLPVPPVFAMTSQTAPTTSTAPSTRFRRRRRAACS